MARQAIPKLLHLPLLTLLIITDVCWDPSPAATADMEPPVKRLGRAERDKTEVFSSRLQPHSRDCDMSVGEWAYDRSYPLYDDRSCPFLSHQLNCQRNGRPDSDYERWRWKPHWCFIPRFNGLDFLGRMRRKRMMLVGDSIMRAQWESLVCMVESVIPADRKLVSSYGPRVAFHAPDFEASIEFVWAPLLVEVREDGGGRRVPHLDSIEENAKHWRGVDLLLFDSAHWWTHSWDFYMEEGRVLKNVNPIIAYEKGLTTWAKWVDTNLDPHKIRVIFRSASASHNGDNGRQCYRAREPLVYTGYSPRAPGQLAVLQEVVKKMSFPVYLLDITKMSALRRDGHPSVYVGASEAHGSGSGGPGWDCSHWCLPGVPDSWNEMLYALLL
ncbi:hypothetical protein AXF42_Ash009252 [Apostasia shenzhenica]|uniref:Uncharacterized protein n=1 Tax=Apostasia shenzhenica TaxID=1088818 RepID=A0A2I0B3J8_9ASPA|nr:hypothetical protein AXF42_Ash009252 [Apostasia shenzhenica]